MTQPQKLPVEGGSSDIFNLDSESQRVDYMRSQGAKNVDPPLQRSSHLRMKTTGTILPWEPILSEQTDIVECCDAHGNTDPAVWGATVVKEALPNDYEEDLRAKSLGALGVSAQASAITDEHKVEDSIDMTPKDTMAGFDTVDYGAINELLDELNKGA